MTANNYVKIEDHIDKLYMTRNINIKNHTNG